MEKVKRILIISSDDNLKKVLGFCFDGWGYEVAIHEAPANDIGFVKRLAPDAIVVDVYSASRSHLTICRLLKDDFITAFIPIITLINKRQLREQLLNLKQGVDDYLIKPPDPLDLRVRIEMAIKRAQYSFSATPLTGLPGGRMIEQVLMERIEHREHFCFGYIDIDGFKYFNDVYGYQRGDSVIVQTAHMLYTAVRKFGAREDFIGHIGGDDFVFISSVERAVPICENFICLFDNIIPFHYTAQDRARGFIVAKDRSRKTRNAPLMSVSIALINRHSSSELRNMLEINEKVAEVKRYLKEIPGSKFMADRRNGLKEKNAPLQVYTKKESVLKAYCPLGQILLERKVVTEDQLHEALMMHWRRDIALGETLKDLGYVQEGQIREALGIQRVRIRELTQENEPAGSGQEQEQES
ncbi:MAG: diguanylate cyclase [Deltaproteobacteria bacterium]